MDAMLENLSGSLDPSVIGPFAVQWGGRFLAALLIFVIGRIIAGWLANSAERALDRGGIDDTLSNFLRSLIFMTLIVVVALTALGTLGVETTNFLAIFGAAGLAIGLAVKDSLSNFSAGVMLVFFRPFKSGDFVETAGVSGTVDVIRIFNTIIKTGDNRVVTVPNSLIFSDTITNFSAEDTRRIDMLIGISYDDDIARARELITEVLQSHDRVMKEPAPVVLLMDLADSSVNIAVRPWVATKDYWVVRAELLERIKAALEGEGLSIPYPQRDLHVVERVNAAA